MFEKIRDAMIEIATPMPPMMKYVVLHPKFLMKRILMHERAMPIKFPELRMALGVPLLSAG